MTFHANPAIAAARLGILAIGFLAAGQPALSGGTATEITGIAALGRELYGVRCSNCHSNEPGKTIFAPTLFGLMGRRAGSVDGFPYTAKITQLGFDWSPETLGGWLQSSGLDSPILRKRHLGIEELSERDALVAYISTLKAR
jgi:cytochrome c